MGKKTTDVSHPKASGISGSSESLQSSEESVIQPGIHLHELPNQLDGTLTITEANVRSGGFSDVSLGTWTRGQEKMAVAIKRLRKHTPIGGPNPEAVRERFERRIRRETSIWQRANHPNILPFIGYQILDDEPVLVSPWCQNGCLSQFLRHHPELTDIQKLQLLKDAARGIAYLHSLQPSIAHGDIKPENILIRDDLTAAVTDFGISRVIQSLDTQTGLTTSSSGQGTPQFQAAELFLEGSRPTIMSDVYAFGGLILATMSGNPPFYRSRAPAAIMLSIASNHTPQPADHPQLPERDPLWDVMRRCWSPDPTQRPSMNEIIAEVRN
ncbi:hypothetical protein M407DRAFT_128692 [Tulasnella calospora MUT 4182]|uniref:Protein kinase domain-containing protein n=1 Tax=Tulasnella calospora MUT 4182 TaxID=1051891 RepID=A0A0C3MCV3_9AGAM|nr:hypothetical protein M407DRAFT_128692 [Tulasnella calospora MUT 4182]